ncbi:hypothetical protein GCM10009416_24940 [Craurococcus roseus]|uniref:Uncharacterized protein n=1 Tax=Craurococcus roseus TaxID=77585 RepID=A0ABP3QCK4_9PROT
MADQPWDRTRAPMAPPPVGKGADAAGRPSAAGGARVPAVVVASFNERRPGAAEGPDPDRAFLPLVSVSAITAGRAAPSARGAAFF